MVMIYIIYTPIKFNFKRAKYLLINIKEILTMDINKIWLRKRENTLAKKKLFVALH